ncbi:hypothetical protein [uncultured Roseobacter sp.]|uniref:hypothetical protein n=1 Tax=uncultured Roseobacter sp. TaxID=114847 RepID=UPI0026037583|nr:hypothetical protein [uncultured Roseobacter sp.]
MRRLFACLGSGNSCTPQHAAQQLSIPRDAHLTAGSAGARTSPEDLAGPPLGVVQCPKTPGGNGIGEGKVGLWYPAHGSPQLSTAPTPRAQRAAA